MKFLISLCLIIFCISFSEQKAKYVNCPNDHILVSDPKTRDGCYLVMCISNEYGGDGIKTCPEELCLPGTQTGYNEPDNSKTFPECCGGPICEQQL